MKSSILFLKKSVLLFHLLMLCVGASQELRQANLFQDHMVLQREMPVPIWGKASPNEQVTITFAGQQKTVNSGKDGNWTIILDAMQASKVGREMVIEGNSKIVISDIVVGEVWICSGQSNMQFPVSKVPEATGLIPFAKNIRNFQVKNTVSFKEEEQVQGQWNMQHPSSAVAFSFAYFLENISDLPVGIIQTSWGSSSLEAWMPRDMVNEFSYFKTIMEAFDQDTLTQHRITEILGKPEGWSRQEDIFLRRQPNILYNAMMRPLAPYAVRGLVWYQGERNTRYLTGMPEVDQNNWFHRVSGMKEYGKILGKWIQRYRQEWKNEEMNFMVVMLPGYGKGTVKEPNIDPENPIAESWAWMRESQLQVLDLPHTAVINTIDLGDEKNIHPTDKLPIGQRLALSAAKNTLGKDILATGPVLKKVEIQKNYLIVHFTNAEGLTTINNRAPTGFWIADESGDWQRANAKIEGETVLLNTPVIQNPKYVRYAFAGKPSVNLVNGMGLPTYPFRTDAFER